MSEQEEKGMESQTEERCEGAGRSVGIPGAVDPVPREERDVTGEEKKEEPDHRLPPVGERSAAR